MTIWLNHLAASPNMHFCVLSLSLISTEILLLVSGHGVLVEPKARNYVAATTCAGGEDCKQWGNPACGSKRLSGCRESNPFSLNGNGIGNVKTRGKGVYPSPPGSHGLCGDPVQRRDNVDLADEPYMLPTPPVATYTGGEIVEFKVGIQAEHEGLYEFRICDKVLDGATLKSAQEGQDCLDKWKLMRAPPSGSLGDSQPIDTRHPGRWYVGAFGKSAYHKSAVNTNTTIVGDDWESDRDFDDKLRIQDLAGISSMYTMRYIIPEGLQCEKCTLQWWWVSANKCAHDKDVGKYWKDHGMNPRGKTTPLCGPDDPWKEYPEEFWNCADISVKPGKNAPPAPTPKPASRRRKSSTRRRRRSSPGPTTRRRGSRRRRRRRRRRRKSR